MKFFAPVLRARTLALAIALCACGAARAQSPAITTQPASQNVNTGTTVTLSVVATDATGYQWYEGTNSLTDGGAISGSTSASLVIANAQVANSGSYSVVVSNASGYVTSSAATLAVAVIAPPTVNSPGTDQAVPEVPITYQVTATGSPNSFAAINLPTGLALDSATGLITGSVVQAGSYMVTLSATNGLGTGSAQLVITVTSPAVKYAYRTPALGITPAVTGVSVFGTTVFLTATSQDTVIGDTSNVIAGGQNLVGSADGPAASARFFHPTGLATDGAGNLYIADTGNDTIRVLGVGGSVSTLAGSPEAAGAVDATGAAARFNGPTALAVGVDGSVYVADTDNQTIRKITATGVVTTLAGSPGISGSADGTGTTARFNAPAGVAVDASGNVYVGDSGNYTVRKITPGGVVTTMAGTAGHSALTDGTGTTASFAQVSGVAVDANGNVFVADTSLREIAPTGQVTTISSLTPALIYDASPSYGPDLYIPYGLQVAPLSGLAIDSQGNLYCINNAGVLPAPNQAYEVLPYIPLELVSAPQNQVVFQGDPASLTIAVTGSNPSYAWWPTGFPIITNGGPEDGQTVGTSATYEAPTSLSGFDSFNGTGDNGSYTVLVYNAGSTVTSGASVTIFEDPVVVASNGAVIGGPLTLTATVPQAFGGAEPTAEFTYQWKRNEVAIPGATAATLTFAALQLSDAGEYTAVVTTTSGDSRESLGSVVNFSGNIPVITSLPVAQTVYAGDTATFAVAATGSGLTYQWFLNSVAIPGATDATLTISDAESTNVGSYSVAVSELGESTTTIPVTLNVDTTRLVNLSVRATAGTGADALIVGFVTSGSDPMQLLIRGIGPGLTTFDVADVLAEPQLDLYDSQGTLLATNAGWGGNPDLVAAFAQVGAFALATSSADSALLLPEPSGSYTAQVTGLGGTNGTALAEIYDADAGTPAQHLLNLSARGQVGTGSSILIGGFVVSGNSPETVLVRGVGPGLAAFGLTGILAQPQIQVIDSSGNVVASNAGWGGAADLAAAFAQVGAFALAADSADAALLATLPPGSYTAQLSGIGGTTGLGLLEIYEVRLH